MRRGDDLGPEELGPDREGRPEPAVRSGVTLRQVLIGILAVVLIAFAVANFEPVEVNFLLFRTEARVVTVVAVAGALGFVIGYFVGRPTKEQRKHLRKREED
ncbi:MAG TPA: lipopolysaccharide assembly protein LapA domain-containing protein [Actinomycetota bacterium]